MDLKLLYEHFLKHKKISTDTRKIEADSIFFALKGPNFNANTLASEALQKGASLAVIDDQEFKGDKTFLVDDVLTALQSLATYHRSHLNIPVIGLTGSNGKTTTKELMNAVLSTKFKTFATKGNLNNHIGVPLSVLSIDEATEIAIIEMGANHVGEIASLCTMASPTHGLITNIGKAHIGTFGGFENIVRGKTELYQHLIENQGTVFINSVDPILNNMRWRFPNAILYPSNENGNQPELLESAPFLKYKNREGEEIKTQLTGSYNFSNIVAALCIGHYFKVDRTKADEAIANYAPANMRSQIVLQGSNTIILDAYNANPSSMEAAIQNLASMPDQNKIPILGDMFELETESETEHRNMGRLLKQHQFKETILCGSLSRWAKEEYPTAKHFNTKEELVSFLKSNPMKNATILIKASRGIGLETILEYL